MEEKNFQIFKIRKRERKKIGLPFFLKMIEYEAYRVIVVVIIIMIIQSNDQPSAQINHSCFIFACLLAEYFFSNIFRSLFFFAEEHQAANALCMYLNCQHLICTTYIEKELIHLLKIRTGPMKNIYWMIERFRFKSMFVGVCVVGVNSLLLLLLLCCPLFEC